SGNARPSVLMAAAVSQKEMGSAGTVPIKSTTLHARTAWNKKSRRFDNGRGCGPIAVFIGDYPDLHSRKPLFHAGFAPSGSIEIALLDLLTPSVQCYAHSGLLSRRRRWIPRYY